MNRNLLQSILGMTNILEQTPPRPDQQSAIRTIQFRLQNNYYHWSTISLTFQNKIGQITFTSRRNKSVQTN
ncbi:MAG: hypothetical protein IPI18_09955 [Saprospiraceae bacterium]|nr:hypothetical protein [Saprospiraceae bacterium]